MDFKEGIEKLKNLLLNKKTEDVKLEETKLEETVTEEVEQVIEQVPVEELTLELLSQQIINISEELATLMAKVEELSPTTEETPVEETPVEQTEVKQTEVVEEVVEEVEEIKLSETEIRLSEENNRLKAQLEEAVAEPVLNDNNEIDASKSFALKRIKMQERIRKEYGL